MVLMGLGCVRCREALRPAALLVPPAGRALRGEQEHPSHQLCQGHGCFSIVSTLIFKHAY